MGPRSSRLTAFPTTALIATAARWSVSQRRR